MQQKTFMWGPDIQAAWDRLKADEMDNPNDSELLRRLVARLSGMEIEERRRGPDPYFPRVRYEIADCGLSTRVSNALIAAGITTLEQLEQVEHLHRINGLGPASIWEIENLLQKRAAALPAEAEE